jgi:hypothetical protein
LIGAIRTTPLLAARHAKAELACSFAPMAPALIQLTPPCGNASLTDSQKGVTLER